MPETRDVTLRIDRVGSFRLILCDEVVIGGPGEMEEEGTVRILASLSSRHARISRRKQGYSIEPLRGSVQLSTENKTLSKHQPRLLIEETYWGNNTQVLLTPEIKLSLEIVSALTQSATLKILPEHRLADRLDGVVLMENMILLGSGKKMHITCPHWEQAGAFIYRDGSFRFCTPVGLGNQTKQVSTQTIDEKITLNQHYCFEEIGFYLEG